MGKLAEILSHPDELVPLASVYLATRRAQRLPRDESLRFCYGMLNRVSRSFAVVIAQLPERLRDAVCVFYLVLRALDTVEDDMALDDGVKVPLLRAFHEASLRPGWAMPGCGAGHYAELMARYPLVAAAHRGLGAEYRRVIDECCRRMGAGMADFIAKDEVASVADYDLYCHYVAGLVGIGLSQLWASSGLEDAAFFRADDASNNMGLFLQKTNIIRDYLEDINEEPAPRMFWPREIWGAHAKALADLKETAHAGDAVRCLNAMVLDALRHARGCLDYMGRLRHPAVLRFCAIPQVMAIATLALCYDNHAVFRGVVKMRRGEAAKVIYYLDSFEAAAAMFAHYARRLRLKAEAQDPADPSRAAVIEAAAAIEAHARGKLAAAAAAARAAAGAPLPLAARALVLALAAGWAAYAWQLPAAREWLGLPHRGYSTSVDHFNRAVAVAFLLYALFMAATGRRRLAVD